MAFLPGGPYTQLSNPVQRGFGTPFCQRQTGRYSPTTGWTFDQDFRGLSFLQMNALASQFGNQGIEYELTLQAGISTLKVTDTSGNQTIDVWEITANQVSVSWLKNSLLNLRLYTIAAAVSGSGDQNVLDAWVTFFVGVLAQGIANNTPGTAIASTITYPPGTGVTEGVFAPTKFFGKSGYNWSPVPLYIFLALQRDYHIADMRSVSSDHSL